jgi:superfamily II DNA or RNA helicase
MLPKHHKTSFFLKSGLFDNLSSFADLEDRISMLPTTIDIGDAFEVFAEAYFFTQKIEQAEEVYPFKSVPSGIKEELSLGTNQQDMGVDGVYKTTSGQFNAYQAKFRTRRPSLTWREISTFMGLTDNVNQRVLFTNCNDMPSVINDRTGFHCIRGNDLDRLEKSDFETILKWLQSGEVEVERKTPLPHQDEAIKDILTALKDEDRATALMACGTGKTLVALWVTEQIDCQSILVLLPSLTLVRQTLHEWLRETKWQCLSYLCVCSDQTVASKELDSIKVNQSDLDFAVTTDTATVKQFLSQNTGGVNIVFSTYQSSNIVAEAMDNNYSFDLGIFDEAHKTTGRADKKFGFALSDENINIQKRLFLTATPRHYNLNKRNKEGDFDLAYSMDNPDVYGKIAHQLSFAVAARQDIICNYKVIISVVTSEQVDKEMLKSGEVLIDGDIVNAQQVAHQIAFKEAINKYGIKRVFSFHKSVKSANIFTGKSPEGIRTQLPEFNTFHVNGTMSTSMREGIMHEFKNSESSIISNARCLTEGVDLPAVDMVAFVSPKKSKVDIVQATGRAMRKDPQNPDKTHGYILVPLYLEMTTGESIENAIDESDFGEVWSVLQALQEQDDVLADIIRQMQVDKGRGKGEKGDDFGDIIDIIGVDISLKSLQESITAVCIDKLGSTWDMRYGELIKYKEQFGQCDVPTNCTENQQLGNWVAKQRTDNKYKKLNDDRIKRLDDIGFVWNPIESQWEDMFVVLKEYKKKHGHCNVPRYRVSRHLADNQQLATWVNAQRNTNRNKSLDEDRIKRLDDIGFVWNPIESQWDEMFDTLIEYKKTHGHCNVPQRWTGGIQLATWVTSQRTRKRSLSNDRIKRLNDIGFAWNPTESQWEEMFDTLKKYKKKHGHCNATRHRAENKQLANWVSVQRRSYQKESLSDDQIKRLDDIGFVWDPTESQWEEMFDTLKEYKEKHGHCNVPTAWAENRQFANWIGKQRETYKSKTIRKDRYERLNDLGFIWNLIESQWEEMFNILIEYKKKHGHCNATRHRTENKQLANWVKIQRRSYQKESLSDDQIKRLNNIDYVWNSIESQWEEMFDTLVDYKKNHGHCNVPHLWATNPQLGGWVAKQRTANKNKSLDKDQIKRLDDIGFVWNPTESQWEEMFDALKEYKKVYGHCKVPRRWEENKKLGTWVGNIRSSSRKGRLSDDQIKRLDNIGFEWKDIGFIRSKLSWDEMFDVLREFKGYHGHCNVSAGLTESKNLVNWVSRQRSTYKNETIKEDRAKRLDDIGFVWDPTESQWEEMFDTLKEYKEKHGHCKVPQNWAKNKQLGVWIGNQRSRKGRLSDDQIKRLEGIGFAWNPHDSQWKRWFDALIKYKESHGHCNVPQGKTENKQLGTWVASQRSRKLRLTDCQLKQLNDIGFEWNIRK